MLFEMVDTGYRLRPEVIDGLLRSDRLMKAVTTHSDLDVPVEHGRNAIHLVAGIEYVMHDVEVESGLRADVFASVRDLPPRPVRFDPARPMNGKLIAPFIGGLGDAISMLPLLAAIRTRFPGLEIVIATTPGPAEIFTLSSLIREVKPYPLKMKAWSAYDWFVSMEAVHETAQKPGRALPEVFADSIGLELPETQMKQEWLKTAGDKHPDLATGSQIRIGLAVGEGDSLRTYPKTYLNQLIERLAKEGVTSVLLGLADPSLTLNLPSESVIDLRSKTLTFASLVSALNSLDLIIAHDSFIMHLAGLLGLPTIGLFAPTSREHASPYPSVQPLMSDFSCAPCHAASGSCPKGYPRCVAWDRDILLTPAIMESVMRTLSMKSVCVETKPESQAVASTGDVTFSAS